jgi:hypothetical protein
VDPAAADEIGPALPCDFCVLVADGRGDAAEVSVFEAVAVSFEADDFDVVDETVDAGAAKTNPAAHRGR